MKGRPPKSAEERLLNGNAGKRALPDETATAPVADAGPPLSKYDPPVDLPEFAQKKWREIMPMLREMGMMRDTDREALRMLCLELWKHDEATKSVSAHGIVYETVSKHGTLTRQNPAVAIMDRASRTIKQLLESLGMTSSGRRRMLAMTKQLDLPFGDEPQLATAPAATLPAEGPDPDDPTGFIPRSIN